MPTKSSNVRRRALFSALGIGLFASGAVAFDEPVVSPSNPATLPPSSVPAKPPVARPAAKDAAVRRTSSTAAGEPVGVPTTQAMGIGVYTPLASAQRSGPSSQGGAYGNSPYPGYEPVMGPGSIGGVPGTSGGGTMGMPGTGAPGSTGAGAPGATDGTTPGGAGAAAPGAGPGDVFANVGTPETTSTGTSASNFLPNVIGDFGPNSVSAPTTPPSLSSPKSPNTPPPRDSVASNIRVFKIAENQSPRPQDRVFFSFNYFNNVDKSINQLTSSPIKSINIYRYVWGFEKTFDEGRGSIGLSLPLYSQFAKPLPNTSSVHGGTSLGDLNIFAKYILKENKQTGSILSTGLLITPPTGPRYLGGVNYFKGAGPGSFVPVHDVQIQPFLGYIFQRDRFYIQGFSALNVAVAPQDVTFFFNDIQIGYFLFRDRESDRLFTAVVPTFEAHISDPLNHRGVTSPDPFKNFKYDPYGTPDTVNFTYGINFEIRRNSVLSFAFAEPLTTFRPFAYEAFVLFNYRFGRSRSLVNPPPAVIGG